MTAAAYKIRTLLILTLLLAWASLAAVNLYIHAVRDREILLKKARRIAWKEADIPAQRGKILDRDGNILARDVFRCDLILNSMPEKPAKRERLLQFLREHFPDIRPETIPQKFPVTLKKNLPAEEIEYYTRIFRRYPEIRTAARFERELHPDPVVRKAIGSTAANDRKEIVGISGLEQQHDLILSGKSGHLVVMLDRNGCWIYETLRITRQPENGQNFKLDQTLSELRLIHSGKEAAKDEL